MKVFQETSGINDQVRRGIWNECGRLSSKTKPVYGFEIVINRYSETRQEKFSSDMKFLGLKYIASDQILLVEFNPLNSNNIIIENSHFIQIFTYSGNVI